MTFSHVGNDITFTRNFEDTDSLSITLKNPGIDFNSISVKVNLRKQGKTLDIPLASVFFPASYSSLKGKKIQRANFQQISFPEAFRLIEELRADDSPLTIRLSLEKQPYVEIAFKQTTERIEV